MPSPSETKTGPETSDGGPAYPNPGYVGMRGMSLRDWFAGQALVGLLSNSRVEAESWSADARNAYCAADAMLAERAKAVR